MDNNANKIDKMQDYSAKIDEITSDRQKFDEMVYTSLEDAVEEIQKRWEDGKLKELLAREYFTKGLPPPLRDSPKLVLFRQLATPNYELQRFIDVSNTGGMGKVVLEYLDDKFTPNNSMKYCLGKLGFYDGVGKKGGKKITYETIIDFNKSNGHKIRDVQTVWGQKLADFHHEMLSDTFPNNNLNLYDQSRLLHLYGRNAKTYYKTMTALFIQNGILFENFILAKDELDFTREVFLPAFFDVWEKTGKKPLIVALESTDKADDEFWFCYPFSSRHIITDKMRISPYQVQSTFAFLKTLLPF